MATPSIDRAAIAIGVKDGNKTADSEEYDVFEVSGWGQYMIDGVSNAALPRMIAG